MLVSCLSHCILQTATFSCTDNGIARFHFTTYVYALVKQLLLKFCQQDWKCNCTISLIAGNEFEKIHNQTKAVYFYIRELRYFNFMMLKVYLLKYRLMKVKSCSAVELCGIPACSCQYFYAVLINQYLHLAQICEHVKLVAKVGLTLTLTKTHPSVKI